MALAWLSNYMSTRSPGMGSLGWSVAQEAKLNSFSAWCFDKLDRPFPQGGESLSTDLDEVQKVKNNEISEHKNFVRGKKSEHKNFVRGKKSEHKNFVGGGDRVLARSREGGQGAVGRDPGLVSHVHGRGRPVHVHQTHRGHRPKPRVSNVQSLEDQRALVQRS